MRKLFFCSVVCSLFVLSSCKFKNSPNNDKIDVKIDIKRLDNQFFDLADGDFDTIYSKMQSDYGAYLNLYVHKIINIRNSVSSSLEENVLDFINDASIKKIKHATDSVFNSTDVYENDIEKAFKYYKFYFPERQIPTVITQISALNQSIVVTDSVLAISLDKYLGSEYPLYNNVGFYKYQQSKMCSEYLVVDAIRVWLQTEFIEDDVTYDLISSVLYQSKILYLTSLMFPDEDIRFVFDFDKNETKWCKQNQKQMWDYFVENNLFFSSDQYVIRNFLSKGPFTSQFGKESPSQAALWMGFDIIESYMDNNPTKTIDDLINETNYQVILQQSKYRP